MSKRTGAQGRKKNVRADDDSDFQEEDNLMNDQQKEEEAMFRQTFNFYQAGKGNVPLERYELPMILDACGYRLPDETLVKMQDYLESKSITKLNIDTLLIAIKWYKD